MKKNDKISSKLVRVKKYGGTDDARGERLREFKIGGVYDILLKLAQETYVYDTINFTYEERLDIIYKKFNEYIEAWDKHERIFNKKQNVNILNPKLLEGLFLSKGDEIKARKLVDDVNEAYNRMSIRYKHRKECKYFRKDDMEMFLDKYIELCRFILTDKYINQEELRSLGIIETLLNIDLNTDDYYFGFYSPFIIYPLMRVLSYIAALPNENRNRNLTLGQLDTRKHITATHAIRSFSRFTIINGKSYIVEYSRLRNQMICKMVDEISSIDNIKPIRLLEKITSHIYNTYNDPCGKDIESFDIAIYGFCANRSDKKKETYNFDLCEIEDLIYEIFSWFEDISQSGECSSIQGKALSLNITYYNTQKVSKKADRSSSEIQYLYNPAIYNTVNGYNKNLQYKCKLAIYVEPYTDFNNSHLIETFDNNDLIFFLDCPWLTTERFTLINEGSMETYEKWFKQVSYKDDLIGFEDSAPKIREFFSKANVFTSLNDQLNRLAVNSMSDYGKVTRVFKDYLLDWIKTTVNESKGKTVYIYNSSLRGLAYSEYVNYPVIREETYGGKKFSIMLFTERKEKCLPCYKDDIKKRSILIPLWSLLKYVDISFAYIGMKQHLVNQFKDKIRVKPNSNSCLPKEAGEKFIKRDFISICRNIIFKLDYSLNSDDKSFSVDIIIELNKPIVDIIATPEDDDLVAFFETITKDVIFTNTKRLGDHYIREAFEKCLYNQARSVNDMFFYHIYSNRRKLEILNCDKVNLSTEIKSNGATSSGSDSPLSMFKEKRIYQKLFEILDKPLYSDFAVYSVINEVGKDNGDDLDSDQIMKNIKDICETYSYTDSFLYKNLNRLINQN